MTPFEIAEGLVKLADQAAAAGQTACSKILRVRALLIESGIPRERAHHAAAIGRLAVTFAAEAPDSPSTPIYRAAAEIVAPLLAETGATS